MTYYNSGTPQIIKDILEINETTRTLSMVPAAYGGVKTPLENEDISDSFNQTVYAVPRVSTIERFHCTFSF